MTLRILPDVAIEPHRMSSSEPTLSGFSWQPALAFPRTVGSSFRVILQFYRLLGSVFGRRDTCSIPKVKLDENLMKREERACRSGRRKHSKPCPTKSCGVATRRAASWLMVRRDTSTRMARPTRFRPELEGLQAVTRESRVMCRSPIRLHSRREPRRQTMPSRPSRDYCVAEIPLLLSPFSFLTSSSLLSLHLFEDAPCHSLFFVLLETSQTQKTRPSRPSGFQGTYAHFYNRTHLSCT